MNLEWQHMFGSNSSDTASNRTMIHTESAISVPEPDHSLHDKSYIKCKFFISRISFDFFFIDRSASCKIELRELLARKQEAYYVSARGRELAEQAAWRSPLPPPGWRCRGTLVAHLHEHRGAINKQVS